MSTLSTHPRIQLPSISRTTSTSGQPTTMVQHHTCSTPHATQLTTNDAPSSQHTSRTASRPSTCPSTRQRPSSQNYLPRRASESSSPSKMLCTHGVLHHMPCGRYGVSSRRARTFWRTLTSPTSIILATLAAAWPRSIASSMHLTRNMSFVGVVFFYTLSLPGSSPCR